MAASPRSLAARVAANSKWARTDPIQGTARARAGFLLKFINEVDPERVLPEAERLRRAEHLLRAHMQRLALRSAKARRKT